MEAMNKQQQQQSCGNRQVEFTIIDPQSFRLKLVMDLGVVKVYSVEKGFGFITPDGGGDDLFVHFSAINAVGSRSLAEGEKVTYDLVTEDGNLKAANVTAKGGKRRTTAKGGKGRRRAVGPRKWPGRKPASDGKSIGTVKWYNVEKGFGFIAPRDGSEDLLVQQGSIGGSWGFKSLMEVSRLTGRVFGVFLASCLALIAHRRRPRARTLSTLGSTRMASSRQSTSPGPVAGACRATLTASASRATSRTYSKRISIHSMSTRMEPWNRCVVFNEHCELTSVNPTQDEVKKMARFQAGEDASEDQINELIAMMGGISRTCIDYCYHDLPRG